MEQNDSISKLAYTLFYWNENNQYIFSRTKFLSFITFIATITGFISYSFISGVIVSFIFSAFVFIIGFLIHKFISIDSSFYECNILNDVKHFLFYWHTEKKNFKISFTKIITLLIVIGGYIECLNEIIRGVDSGYALGTFIGYCIIATPIFLLGYAIHKWISKNNVPSVSENNYGKINNPHKTTLNIDKSNMSPNFSNYLLKTEKLKKEFDEKELKTKELIKTKFSPPQITYDRFMAVVDNCSKIFNEQYNAVLNIINLANNDSEKVDDEIISKIDILQSFIDKLDDLSNELVINMSKSKNNDINNALDDMEDLIASIDNYEN